MALIHLTKSTDGIQNDAMVLRGESLDSLALADNTATGGQFAVAVKFRSGDDVLLYTGTKPAADALFAKIRAGM